MHAILYLGGGAGVIALITALFVATTARRYAALLLLGSLPTHDDRHRRGINHLGGIDVRGASNAPLLILKRARRLTG